MLIICTTTLKPRCQKFNKKFNMSVYSSSDSIGSHDLRNAVQSGKIDEVLTVLEREDNSILSETGSKMLQIAVSKGYRDIVNLLLFYGVNPNDDVNPCEGNSIYNTAIEKGDLGILKVLSNYGIHC